MLCSVYGKKMAKMIPFIIGIAAGYIVATIFTLIGNATGNADLQVVNFSLFSEIPLLLISQVKCEISASTESASVSTGTRT